MSGTSAEHIQTFIDLEQACEAATFGRNQEDVLDESYRKAGKMAASAFMTRLDPHRPGLVNAIRLGLLERTSVEGVRAELCKLNVYGEQHTACPVLVPVSRARS